MLVESILHGVSWHVIACWVDVLKSLAHHLFSAWGSDIAAVVSVGDGKVYTWRPPVLSLVVAVFTTTVSVSFKFVIFVIDAKY